jgi:hypothetical protein
MFGKLKDLFGIPSSPGAEAKRSVFTDLAVGTGRGPYAPESQLDADTLHAVQPDGSVWEPWRVDRQTGEMWYKRVSRINGIAGVDSIQAIADGGGDLPIGHGYDLSNIPEDQQAHVAGELRKAAQARIAARQLSQRAEILGDGENAGDDQVGQ